MENFRVRVPSLSFLQVEVEAENREEAVKTLKRLIELCDGDIFEAYYRYDFSMKQTTYYIDDFNAHIAQEEEAQPCDI